MTTKRMRSGDEGLVSLEALRARLLDLTRRNRLINYRHSPTSSLRVIDELPDQLHKSLLEGTALRFLPVPEPTREQLINAGYIEIDPETGEERRFKKNPTADQWASHLELETAYEMPRPKGKAAGKHTDRAIQTLLYPYELETRLRKLTSKARLAIEETGTNILFMAFGFLEWNDHNETNGKMLAPLILVPATLEKGKLNKTMGTYEYVLAYSGEDLLTNLSLREKLRSDFAFELPELDDSDTPESYFKRVSVLLAKSNPRWMVRRYVTLGLLNFSKLLMHLDLDNDRWPAKATLLDHPIVSKFFSNRGRDGRSSATGIESESPYNIDDIEDVHAQYPLIDDADSSQHSAIIDAVRGRNLVIEGPPGTGKSQTITNLIAAAVSQGKSVLFVSEKLAALEVVKERLEKAGMGEFCLELHSHKTQKKKVLYDIHARIIHQNRYRSPRDIEADIGRYEELKETLHQYAHRVNAVWQNTGQNIFEIFTAAVRYQHELSVQPELVHPKDVDGTSFTPVAQRRWHDVIRSYGEFADIVIEQLPNSEDISSHPWYGVRNNALQLFETERVYSELKVWLKTLKALTICLDRYREMTACYFERNPDSHTFTLPQIRALIDDLQHLPEPHDDETFSSLPQLVGDKRTNNNLQSVKQHLSAFPTLNQQRKILSARASKLLIQSRDTVEAFTQRIAEAQKKGVKFSGSVAALETHAHTIQSIEPSLRRLFAVSDQVAKILPPGVAKQLGHTEQGLKGLRDFVRFADALPSELIDLRDPRFEDNKVEHIVDEFERRRDSLLGLGERIGQIYALNRLPNSSHLEFTKRALQGAAWPRSLRKEWRKARREIRAFAAQPKTKVKQIATQLSLAIEYASQLEALQADKDFARIFGNRFEGLDTDSGSIRQLIQWYRQVDEHYALGFDASADLGQALRNLPTRHIEALQNLVKKGILEALDGTLTKLGTLAEVIPKLPTQQESISLLDEERGLPSIGRLFSKLTADRHEHLIEVDITFDQTRELLSQINEFQQTVDDWIAQHETVNNWFSGKLHLSLYDEADYEPVQNTAEHTVLLAEALQQAATESLRITLVDDGNASKVRQLIAFRTELAGASDIESSARDVFQVDTKLDIDAWLSQTGDEVEAIMQRAGHALENRGQLGGWLDYIRMHRQVLDIGFERLASAVETGLIPPRSIELGYKLGIYHLLSTQIIRKIPLLSQFSAYSHESIQQRFREYDEKLKKLQRQRISARVARKEIPTGTTGARKSDYTELQLLQLECSKQRKHIPIRQLLNRAGEALKALKPCFMMGPMSVAQYLQPGQLHFDLIVMDEASQLRPENALGAIARGTQIIVVGDPNQLPPTDFFEKYVDNEEDDPTVLQDSESILDAVSSMFPRRRLNWHYRSQHESLIAFSNLHFYDRELILFPSPYYRNPEYGIKYEHLPIGRFVNRQNTEEALRVAEATRDHFSHHPEESLGLVAMNSQQRDHIERAVETLAKEDAEFSRLRDRQDTIGEPLFIKNLENVQGDERDVIMISMTYGPQEPGGRVLQRFGPINSDTGWRRLNVLFTRAKKRMCVFSSMSSYDIQTDETSNRGVRALRNFLNYCEAGGIPYNETGPTDRDPDSDFEIAVASRLTESGFDCVYQVGVEGFFIDIGVKDPGSPGRYLMGIECDGATYHSAKSARDRDRLRQTVLERLNWRIRRIWSTDWFKNPDSAIADIVRELNELKTESVIHADELSEETESSHTAVEYEGSKPDDNGDSDNQTTLVHSSDAESFHLAASDDLTENLRQFDGKVLRVEFPDTPDEKRLLRPAMLEALVEYQPTTSWEFLEQIPRYLRNATSPAEAKRLDEIFRIIEDMPETGTTQN